MFNEREDKCGEITGRQGVAEGGEGERQTRKSNACFGGGLRHCVGSVLLGFLWPIILLRLALAGLKALPRVHIF